MTSEFLKERLFGLSNPQGNHGESVKEAHFHLDNTPTVSRFHLPRSPKEIASDFDPAFLYEIPLQISPEEVPLPGPCG